MKIYLARHGEAVPSEVNPECPLSEKGKNQIERVAKFIKPLNITVSYVFHSGKMRAKQTAEKLATSLIVEEKIEAREGLNPMDDVNLIAQEIRQADADILYVGHMPFMGKLVAALVTDNENQDVVSFHTGTLICLEQIGPSEWIVEWVIYPELL